MADQTQRLEIATVRAEVGSNILSRFSNDAVATPRIPTESGDIPNLKQVIAEIQEEGAEKISVATTIYPTVAAGLAATPDGGIFLVQSSEEDEIYVVWRNEAGAAVNTGKTAMSSQAIEQALEASNQAAQAAEDAADVAINRTAGFLQPAAEEPVLRDDGLPLQVGDRYFNTEEQAEYIYKQDRWVANDGQQAVADLESDLATLDDPEKGAALWVYKGRDGYQKLGDTLSVRDYIKTSVDGTTSNQDGIVDAVAAAYLAGADLYWPRGVYVSDKNIPNFHKFNHVGPGVIKRGFNTWVISGRAGDNYVYVSVDGNDSSDGLTAAKPFQSVQAALDIFNAPYMASFLSGGGIFRLQFAAGTWTDGGSFTGHLMSRNATYIQGTIGPDGNTPLTVIDGTASTKTAGIYMDGGPSNIYVKDIICQNFRANSVASGFVFANKGIGRLFCDNLYSKNNLWAGVNADSIGQLSMQGGVHDNNSGYNLRVRGGCGY